MWTKTTFSFFVLCLLCITRPAQGAEPSLEILQNEIQGLKESVAGLQSMVRSQSEVIQKQGLRIAGLEGGGSVLTDRPRGWNPDIGVIGTVQAKLTEDSTDGEGNDTIALKEIELNLAQYVDPFSRLDAVLSFNDALEAQNTEIEEAYYTRWGLPFGFSGQIWEFRSKAGKQNLLHLDQLETTDYPLVIQNFFGEEGLASSGVRLQNWLPNPWDLPIEITGEILRGNNGASFSQISRRPIFNTHVKTFFEPDAGSTLEIGGTAMFGDENPRRDVDGAAAAGPARGQDRYGVHLLGLDLTWIRDLSEERKLKFQNELLIQDRGGDSSLQTNVNHNPWGFYSLLDYRFSSRFSAGVRFDYLEPLATADEHGRTTAISPYFTFWQSEFAWFRLQYSHSDPASAGAEPDDAIFFQANFLIGAHNHPVQ